MRMRGVMQVSPCTGGYMSLEMDSLAVGGVVWSESVQMRSLISRRPPSCGFCFYLNEGFIISDGKNTFVRRITFYHQAAQC